MRLSKAISTYVSSICTLLCACSTRGTTGTNIWTVPTIVRLVSRLLAFTDIWTTRSVNQALLSKTDHTTHCGWKGDAKYYSINLDSRIPSLVPSLKETLLTVIQRRSWRMQLGTIPSHMRRRITSRTMLLSVSCPIFVVVYLRIIESEESGTDWSNVDKDVVTVTTE